MLTFDVSNLPRIMQCTGSYYMPVDMAVIERDTTIREEGNAAHWLIEQVFNGKFALEELNDRNAPNGVMITAEMSEHVADYLSAIDRASAVNFKAVEHSYTHAIENIKINGRIDHVAWIDGILSIDDFKYGYSIVEPDQNYTLIAHAAGFCLTNNIQPQSITLSIHQPRAPHRNGTVRSWTITYAELIHHYHVIIGVLSTIHHSTELQTGPACYKCPAFVNCPARQDAETNALEVASMTYSAAITDDDLSSRMMLISRAQDMLKQSAKAYEDQILHRIKSGNIIKNFAVEPEYTNRVWKDGTTIEIIKALTGVDLSDKPKMVTPKQAETTYKVPKDIVAIFADRKFKGNKLVYADHNKRARKLLKK